MKGEMCPKCIPLPLEQQISKFWELDSVGVIDGEQSVYDKFESSIKIENNRYEVNLPFKADCPLIEDNYATAVQRLKGLRKKLDRTPDTLQQYNGTIMQQLNAGIRAKVITPCRSGGDYVFTASSRFEGTKINKTMYSTPAPKRLVLSLV